MLCVDIKYIIDILLTIPLLSLTCIVIIDKYNHVCRPTTIRIRTDTEMGHGDGVQIKSSEYTLLCEIKYFKL